MIAATKQLSFAPLSYLSVSIKVPGYLQDPHEPAPNIPPAPELPPYELSGGGGGGSSEPDPPQNRAECYDRAYEAYDNDQVQGRLPGINRLEPLGVLGA